MQTLSTEQVQDIRKQDGKTPLINVLPEEAFEKAHIPGTRNIPVGSDDFVSRVEKEAGGKEQPVVVYCANKECDASPKAAKQLEDAGFKHVFDYEGGTEAWKQAGLDIEGKESAAA